MLNFAMSHGEDFWSEYASRTLIGSVITKILVGLFRFPVCSLPVSHSLKPNGRIKATIMLWIGRNKATIMLLEFRQLESYNRFIIGFKNEIHPISIRNFPFMQITWDIR